MGTKNVLISYLEWNKKFTLPVKKELSDVEFLRKEFLKAFAFNERSVNLIVTFQIFEKEWDEFVEIEEDAVIADKAKLKAVVMPILGETCSTLSQVSKCEY